MKLIFIGPPGAGKGTQSERICRDFGIVQISTGDILRSNMSKDNELGRAARLSGQTGQLVPDELILSMIKDELKSPRYQNGYVLDGFPRTVTQAEEYGKILDESGEKLDAVLVLKVDEEELIGRLTARRTCTVCGKSYHLIYNPPKVEGKCDLGCGDLIQRDDDREEPIRNRLVIYNSQTKPLVDYYSERGLAKLIDGRGNIEEIYTQIKQILDPIDEKLKKTP